MLKPNGVSLLDLGVGQCRWPHAGASRTLFCGEPVQPGCSWCSTHRAVVFTGPAGEPKQPRS